MQVVPEGTIPPVGTSQDAVELERAGIQLEDVDFSSLSAAIGVSNEHYGNPGTIGTLD